MWKTTLRSLRSLLNPQKPTGGIKSNAYLTFDYQSEDGFKITGINVSTNKLEIGHRTEAGWVVDVQGVHNKSLKANTNYNVFVAVNGTVVTLVVDGRVSMTHTFDPRLDDDGTMIGFNQGMVGLGANNAKAAIDNIIVQRLAPEITFTESTDFSAYPGNLLIDPNTTGWISGEGVYTGDGTSGSTVSLMRFGVAPAAVVNLLGSFSTTSEGGFVFDYYAPDDFKFVILSTDTNELHIGHRTSSGWTIDASYQTDPVGGDLQDLEVTLKSTSVSIKLNNQLVLGYAFNSLITDGAQGLLAVSGETVFNAVKFQTDDLSYSVDPVPEPDPGGDGPTLIPIVPIHETPSSTTLNAYFFTTISSPELIEFSDPNLDDPDDELVYLY